MEITRAARVVHEFRRINLDGKLFRPGMDYIRELDYAYQCAVRRIYELEEIIARSGNHFLQKDAGEWQKENRLLKQKNASLQAKITELEAEHRMEVLELTNRADWYENEYKKLIEINSRTAYTNRNKKSGQFVSADGMSRQQKEDKAYDMFVRNVGYAEIGRALKISAQTAKTYVKKSSERRAHEDNIRRFEERKKRLEAM